MKKVLIVDDHDENRYYVKKVLEYAGWDVVEGSNGQEALSLALSNPPDLIISDILMPVMDGFALCGRVRDDPRLSDVKFVFLTATFCELQDRKLALSIGADEFLQMPIEGKELLNRIEEVVERMPRCATKRREAETASGTVLNDHQVQYSHSMIRKLEEKMGQLENANRLLKKEREERRKSESEREKFFHLSSDLLCVGSMDGYLIDVNEACRRLFGYERETLLSRPFKDFVHPEDWPITESKLAALFNGEQVNHLLNRCRTRDGSWLWMEWQGTTDEDGYFYVSARDVTDRIQADYEMKLLYTAVMTVPFAIVITDTQGRIEMVNPEFEKMTGYKPSEVMGKTTKILKSGRHDDAFYNNLWKTILGGQSWSGELVNRRKDGTFYTERMSITPVMNAAKEINHFIAVKQDVTREKEQEKRILRSQRMESIGLLAGGIAHDLNNVLAPMMMALDILKNHSGNPDNSALIDILESNCRRGAGIISQVLTFARGIEGKNVTLQLRHIMKDMVKMGRETFPKNIQISTQIASDLWAIHGDATQLQQVLLNLAVNARDAMPNGGMLKLSAENFHLSEPKFSLNICIDPGRYVRVSVEDTGSGIDPAHQDHIFEPFFTTKEEGRGTGLGLPTVFGIVKSHRGLIDLKSTPGKGTVFEVYLPASDQESEEKDPAPVRDLPKGRGQTLLIVDDENAVLEVTKSILEANGYRVLSARDGAEALEMLSQNRDLIKGVITDVIMPVMDGVELVAAMKKLDLNTGVIGSSGYTGDGSRDRTQDLKDLGVKVILRKPYSIADLLFSINQEFFGLDGNPSN